MNFLLNRVIIFVSNLINLRVFSAKLNHEFFFKPVSEFESRRFTEFISKPEITLTNRGLFINLEVINPGFLFGLNDLVSAVKESEPVHLRLNFNFHDFAFISHTSISKVFDKLFFTIASHH